MDFFHKLPKPTYILAPMVNNSGLAYRKLAMRYNSHLTYTEMVHCKVFNTTRSDPRNNRWYNIGAQDFPLVIQICGNDPDEMLKTAKQIQDYCDAIDINFGCPQNIAKSGFYGAFLQKDLLLTKKIIETLVENTKVPIFCKIRIFKDIAKTVEYAKMIEAAGCSLLVVHGRTIDQKGINTGLADLNQIKAVKKALQIPVIANGNVRYQTDIDYVLKETGCDGIMVAESHLHNPLIFSSTKKSCFSILHDYFDLCKEIKTKMQEIKSHTFKILHNVLSVYTNYRERIQNAKALNEVESIVYELDCIANKEKKISLEAIARIRT